MAAPSRFSVFAKLPDGSKCVGEAPAALASHAATPTSMLRPLLETSTSRPLPPAHFACLPFAEAEASDTVGEVCTRALARSSWRNVLSADLCYLSTAGGRPLQPDVTLRQAGLGPLSTLEARPK